MLMRDRHVDPTPVSPRGILLRRVPVAVVVLAMVVPLGITTSALRGGVADAATGASMSRVSGSDRYGTAAAIADAGWPTALPKGSTLLLATGENYPDAVSAAAAAGHLGVPLLLTASGSLSPSTAAEITRLKPATVVLVGSSTALNDTIASQVGALGPTVTRWQGSDRYATAAAVSQATYPNGATNVYLATGGAFPDALAGAALAAVAGGPLLLTDPNTLSQATAAEIARLHPSAVIALGSTGSVSDSVLDDAVKAGGGAQKSRIQGPDRYQTADAVASVLVQVHGGATASKGVLLATGLNFADALAGAAWAGASDRPLLLAPGTYVMPHTVQALQGFAAPSVAVLGGPGSVSDAVLDGLRAGTPPTSPPR